jgi:SOS-response transcriptional repressor LexA
MQGQAMARAGVRHKDLLLIEPSEHYANDSIVLVFADGQPLIRRWQRTKQGGLFVPSDDKLPPIPYDDSCIIRGQVIASITLHTKPRFMLPEVVS